MQQIQQTLHKIAGIIDARLKSELTARGKVASGNLFNSIQTEVLQNEDGYQLNTLMAEHGQFVNDGRQAGSKKVPIGALIEWLKLKGITSGDRELKDAAFAIQLEIYRNGIPATGFIDAAFEGLETQIEQLLAEAANQDLQTEFDNLINL